jgi:type I restriction enzyme S subunit
MSFPRYPAYKDSGVEWLGEVPEHWPVCALSYRYDVALGKMLDEKRITGEHLAPYLRNVDVQWGRININDLPEMDFHSGEVARYGLAIGDLLVCEGGEVGRAAIWDGALSECYYQKALHRVRPHDKHSDVPNFLFYILAAAASRSIFEQSQGKSTISHLTAEAFRRYRFPFPSRLEQISIATFLDRETAKIDALVADYRALIELLQEKCQAVISHAVTNGLDPSVPMKDSGVDWLGEVPEHWEVGWIKRWCQTTSGGTPDTNQQDLYYAQEGGIPWIRTMDLTNERLLKYEVSITQRALLDTACSVLPVESVLIAMYGGEGTIGKNGLLKISATVNQAVCAIHPSDSFVPEFLWRYVQHYRPYWMIGAESSRKDPNISQDLIRSSPVLRPPISEQQELARWIDQQCDGLAALITDAQEAITLLHERRTALISAAVTGKIDVRGLVELEAA